MIVSIIEKLVSRLDSLINQSNRNPSFLSELANILSSLMQFIPKLPFSERSTALAEKIRVHCEEVLTMLQTKISGGSGLTILSYEDLINCLDTISHIQNTTPEITMRKSGVSKAIIQE